MSEHDIQPYLGAASLMGLLTKPRKQGPGVFGACDRRKNIRVRGLFPIYLWVEGKRYKSIAHNISYDGVFIETGKGYLPGDPVTLCLQLDPVWGCFHMKGSIVRNSPHGIGVRLIRTEAAGQG